MDFSKDLICENLTAVDGVLHFAGQNTADLAAKYGTPLYLMDENRIRRQAAVYRDTLRECFGDKGHALFASKACAFKRMYAIMAEEGLSVDVVSCGEMATAYAAGFPMEHVYFHSNNKTDFVVIRNDKAAYSQYRHNSFAKRNYYSEEVLEMSGSIQHCGFLQILWDGTLDKGSCHHKIPHSYAAI